MSGQFYLLLKHSLLGVVISLFVAVGETNGQTDWPAFMGLQRNGLSSESHIFSEEGIKLQVEWLHTLGSGYSGVAVAADIAVVMYSKNHLDYVQAFVVSTGNILWKYTIGPTYKGHGNSQDGPLSTPALSKEHAFCLTPHGTLLALELNSGALVWERNLVQELAAPPPHWGFVTSPLLFDDIIILMVGSAEDGLLVGFEQQTGKILWRQGEDSIRYQSPTLGDVHGTPTVVAAGDSALVALDPVSGKVLWHHVVEGGLTDGTMPIVVPPDKILVRSAQNGLLLLRVNKTPPFEIETVWANHKVKKSYGQPLVYEDHIYVYSGRFLSCVSMQSGEISWKSRHPGDGFIIAVDRHLVALTKKGRMHVIEIDSLEYREKTSLQVFDDLAWTHPSFSNGKIYARSYGQIARIGVSRSKESAAAKSVSVATESNFLSWLKRVERVPVPQRASLISQFMKKQLSFPIVESEGVVHFVYQGDATDLAISGDHVGLWDEAPMQRITGTDFFYSTSRLKPASRIKYRFIKNYEEKVLDPLNPLRVEDTLGGDAIESFSWLSLPGWSATSFDTKEHVQRDTLESRQIDSAIMGTRREVKIYLPPNYKNTEKRYPVVYLHLGMLGRRLGHVDQVVDQLIRQRRIDPILLVLIQENAAGYYDEIFWNAESMQKYAEMFVKEIVPFIDQNYRTVQEPIGRTNVGMGFSGCVAMYTGLKYPNKFAHLASQSSVFWDRGGEKLVADLIKKKSNRPAKIYLEWGKYDFKRHHMDVLGIRERNQRFYTLLAEDGQLLAGGEVNAGFGWSSWRHQIDEMLEFFYPYSN
ncbi:MAG: PQQ-binding-like beta-propeller repeat protein [Gemmatimonadetes bacterium]|nr:PQQ-binding-like beta-propeller repeat protein [Gemmatimonadota bacterium]